MEPIKVDVAVIGAGPGGYVSAIRCRQLGLSVMCIDKGSTLGGTCLNVGCIPSKTLLDISHKFYEARHHFEALGIRVGHPEIHIPGMMERKNKVISELTQGIQFLFRKNDVSCMQGAAKFHTPHELHVTLPDGQVQSVEAHHIIIATGSESTTLPHIPVDEETILTSTGALSLENVPSRLLIVGGGYIGVELGVLWHRLGSQVTIIEAAEEFLPLMDKDIGAYGQKLLSKMGIHCRRGHHVLGVDRKEDGVLHVQVAPAGENHEKKEAIEADKVLIAVGRRPHTHGLGLEHIGMPCDERGLIVVNASNQSVAHTHIFAIGDVVAGPMLAHKASEEGIMVAEHIAGAAPSVLAHHRIPSVIFTSPEMASVGWTEQKLVADGVPYKVGRFALSANSRARAIGATEGFVKVLAHAHSDEVLGVHIVGSEASTLISEAVLALEYGASSEDLARICYPHPTFGEALKEAALAVSGQTLHA